MRCRSESVKRTVVDLSFSFFMSVNFCIKEDWPVVAQEHRGCQKTSERHLGDIALRRIFAGNCVTITKVMYKLHPRENASPSASGLHTGCRGGRISSRRPPLRSSKSEIDGPLVRFPRSVKTIKLTSTLRPLRNSEVSGTLFESNSTLLLS